jgi:multidrug resistance efflux pump
LKKNITELKKENETLNLRIKDLVIEKDELLSNIDSMNKQIINLEKSENYQNDILDRLQKEKTKLEILNVDYSEKLQKTEIELMNRTKEKDDITALHEKNLKIIQNLKKTGIINMNKIVELENKLSQQKSEKKKSGEEFKEIQGLLEKEIKELKEKVAYFKSFSSKFKHLLKYPKIIQEKIKKIHLLGIKINK